MFSTRVRKTYWASVFSLVGHLAGTAIIFTSLITLGWLVSYLLHFLHGIHQFSDDIFKFITEFELYLIYADAGLCAFVLLAVMKRFCKELMEADQ